MSKKNLKTIKKVLKTEMWRCDFISLWVAMGPGLKATQHRDK